MVHVGVEMIYGYRFVVPISTFQNGNVTKIYPPAGISYSASKVIVQTLSSPVRYDSAEIITLSKFPG